MKRNLVLVGDIHGEYRTLVWKITNQYQMKDTDIVVLGDFGVGFDNTMTHNYKWSEKKLEDSGNMIYTLRGNHDDPLYFTDESKYSYPRLIFMEDYKLYTLGDDRVILPIGGANSIDIEDRLKNNQKWASMGSDRRCWWEDEDVKRVDPETLPLKVDIILSHESPLVFDPIPSRPDICPVYQYEKILSTRKYLSTIIDKTNTDNWFFGHYHTHLSGTYGKVLWRCLDIMEFYQAPEKKNNNPQGEI